MIIKVKQKHINKGLRYKNMSYFDRNMAMTECCPVALAMKDNGYDKPYVSDNRIYQNGKLICSNDLVRQFTRLFDARKEVKPFEFEL